MNKFKYNFHLFTDYEAPQQKLTSNPNWTGQAYHNPQEEGKGTYASNQDLSVEMKTFYDKALIRLAEANLVHDQFGQKRPIPAGNGKTIEFRQFSSLPKATTPLTEGITPSGQSYGVTAITATISQYGAYITTTDMLNLTAFDNEMAEITRLLGSQAGRTSDTLTRDVLAAGTNVIYADADTTGGANDSRTDLAAADVLTVLDVKKAVRLLKRNNAPKINGYYVGIVHTDAVFDLEQDDEWTEAAKYAGAEQLFTGELGRIGGVRFVESTEAKIWKDSTCPVASGSGESTVYRPVYGTLILGANAFGVTSINGNGIETIAKQLGSSGVADALNQRASMGWKMNKAVKVLTQEYMVRIEHTSSYGTDAEAN